jgi:hypothetical protein
MRIYQRGYFKVYSAWNSLSLIQTSISVGSMSPHGRLTADVHLQSFGFLACSFVLAQRVVAGNMEVGNYVTFVNYLAQIYGPLNQVSLGPVHAQLPRGVLTESFATNRSPRCTEILCATCETIPRIVFLSSHLPRALAVSAFVIRPSPSPSPSPSRGVSSAFTDLAL